MFANRYANNTTCSLANIYTFLHNNKLFKYTIYSHHVVFQSYKQLHKDEILVPHK